MKKWFLISAIALITISSASAQTAKVTTQRIGFLNLRIVLDSLPMKNDAMAELKKLNDYFSEELANMKKEYEAKLGEYDVYSKGATVDPIIKEMMENTLKTMDENMYTKNQKYQELLQKKQSDLLVPILDSIKSSTKIVAKQKGYTQVMDVSSDIMIYNSTPADDITNSVIKYMRTEALKPATPKPVTTPK